MCPSPINTDLFAGIDNLSLDTRKFDPSRDDIEGVCNFFSIGKLLRYEKEKGIIISHSNFFIFVATTHGQYALKFYPPGTGKTITIEYAINRILAVHHFPTPVMYAGHGGEPFFSSNDRLVTCFAYIDGLEAWQHFKEQNTFPQINAALLSLKNILSATKGRVPFLKQESLVTSIKALTQTSRAMDPYDQKEMIDASMLDAYQTYQQHRSLFTRQWLHNNATLTNFLVYKETVHTLDLSHIREDYTLSDLASLVISCLVFDIPADTIKTITNDYFIRHKKKSGLFPVLNALIKVELIKKYLKNVQREKSIELSTYPQDLMHTYMSHLSRRQRSITAVLKKMNDNPRLIV